MFRRYLSNFWKMNKDKFYRVAKICAAAMLVLFIVMNFLKTMPANTNNLSNNSEMYNPTYTITTGSTVKQTDYDKDSNIVDEFIKYCNNKEVEKAYNLLSKSCKEELYPSLAKFEAEYCNKYFASKKQYNLQSWFTRDGYNTYKIRILEDILSTGNYIDSKKYEDYITVIDDKISINGYIGQKLINKEHEEQGFHIEIVKVDIYMEFEKYTIIVTNNRENTILLDDMQSFGETLSLVSFDDKIYNNTETLYTNLTVKASESKEIQLKFNRPYSSNNNIKYIQFQKIVTNYKEFIQDKINYNDRIEIKINLY